jgi:hypothetical protein
MLHDVSSGLGQREFGLFAADAGASRVRAVLVGARHAIHPARIVHAYAKIRAIRLSVPIAGIGRIGCPAGKDADRCCDSKNHYPDFHNVSFQVERFSTERLPSIAS